MPPIKKSDSGNAPPIRGQKSLTSFFGAAKSSKTGEILPKKKVQTGIKGAFTKQATVDVDVDANKHDDKKEEEEEVKATIVTKQKSLDVKQKKQVVKINEKEEEGGGDDDLMDTDDEEEEVKVMAKSKSKQSKGDYGNSRSKVASRKRIIDDEDEEEEVVEEEEEEEEEERSKKVVQDTKSKKKNKEKVSKMEVDSEDDEEEGVEEADEKEDDDHEDDEEEEYKDDDEQKDDDTASVDEEEMDNDSEDNEEEEEEDIPLQKLKSKTNKKAKPKNSFFSPKSKKHKTNNDDNNDNDDQDENDDDAPSSKTKSKSTSTISKASNKNNTANKSTTTAASKTSSSKSEAAARGMKSNDALLSIISTDTDTWKTATTASTTTTTTTTNKNSKNNKSSAVAAAAVSTNATPYSALCDTFTAIEAISGRLEIQEKMTELFRMVLLRNGGGVVEDGTTVSSSSSGSGTKKNNENDSNISDRCDIYDLLYLASNSVAPSYECVELGVGDSILIKAIGEASGTNPSMIKKKYDVEGDLGTVAQTCKGKQRTLVGFGKVGGLKSLMVKEVLTVFRQIATTSGSQSQKWKVDKIKGLLVRAKGSEAKYIIRGLQGKLRIGLAQTTVLASLSHAVVLTHPHGVMPLTEERLQEIRGLDGKEGAYPDFARKMCEKNLPLETRLETAVNIVKKAYSEVPSFDSLLDALLNVPLQELHKTCTLTPGIPVEPMLAKPTKSVLEVLKRLNGARFTCEYKYDGERAQVHMTPDGVTKVFSRSLLNTSEKFPEVPLYVQESCKDTAVSSFVLDTEVVAWNRETKQFVPFQVLSTRKKTEESAESAKVQVIVQAFDLMYLNGKSLLDRTLAERRDLMRKNFVPIEGKFQFATALDHTENGDTAVIEEFLDNAVKGQCEGLMVKTLDINAAYEPSRRSLNWLKLKKDYLEGLGDSVDLVPLGAYHGKGKRTGVFGAYLLACYDVDTEEFQSVCKIGTGFSEENLKELAASLNKSIIPGKSSQYNVADVLECDVWFDAVQVWEVKAADLSKSSTHKGAIDKTGESGRGIGLRFPRFERIRPDKKPEDATTSDQILEMYYAQDSIVGADGGMEEDGI